MVIVCFALSFISLLVERREIWDRWDTGATSEDKHILTLAAVLSELSWRHCLTVFAYFLIKHKAESDERTDRRTGSPGLLGFVLI